MSSDTTPPLPSARVSISDEMTEVFAPGTTPKSVFPTSPHALPVGARIGEFEVHRLIGEGGFGIVYLCYDQALDRYVALKEYMPSSLATRENATLAIVVKAKQHAETFDAGLKSFINEARLLAQFDHPSLLKVYRFWQANGTAYMTMPYYEGPTLKQALAALNGPPDEATLRSWLLPMLDALEVIHRASCYHRDIAPDNILLTATGPLLLDFGAARRVIGDMTQALTVVLKPGFAPIEQYGDAAAASQGAWTDLYALASVVYFAVTGRPPMSAVDRVMDDRLEPLSHRVAGRYSHALLATVDTALSLRPQDRPQSVASFRAMLNATGDEQTADLHLWGDDDAPTEVDTAAPTVPGALPDAALSEPRTVPTARKSNPPPAPSPVVAAQTALQATAPSAKADVAPAPLREALPPAERTVWAPREPHTTIVESSVAAANAVARQDDQPRTQFVPRPTSVAAVSSGAGLAPLSGAAGATQAHTRQGLPAPLPPRPPLAERTAMPSLLAPQAALPQGATSVFESARSSQPLPVNKKPTWVWTVAAVLAALALALGAAAWFFSRPESPPSVAPPAAPVGTTPAPATPAAPTPAVVQTPPPAPVPAPAPAPVKVADPVPPAATPATKSPPVQAASPARQLDGGQPRPANNTPKGTPPIRLGAQPSAKVDADSPVVLPRNAPTAAPVPPPTPAAANTGAGPRSIARCADIRQRAGLEDLSAEDRQFLRTQCR
ncbi:MAG: serine/threonine protein kinase [Burkholderiales bacterium]